MFYVSLSLKDQGRRVLNHLIFDVPFDSLVDDVVDILVDIPFGEIVVFAESQQLF